MIKIKHDGGGRVFERVKVFYTLQGNKKSEKVLERLREVTQAEVAGRTKGWGEVECKVFSSPEEIDGYFEAWGIPCDSGIILMDCARDMHFRYITRFRGDTFPDWAKGAVFGVLVGERTIALEKPSRVLGCAHHVSATFIRHWDWLLPTTTKRKSGASATSWVETTEPWFPWGAPGKREAIPQSTTAKLASSVLASLNGGPDFATMIAHHTCASELPPGSRISWFRVSDAHLECDRTAMEQRAISALRMFEEASAELVERDEEVRRMLLAGVDLQERDVLAGCYLYPPRTSFSVRRPDFHWAGGELFASENDEMPGGLGELIHVDQCYGVNQAQWEKCFRRLTEKGTVLFVVSHDWSKCYIPEFLWATEYLRGKGYDVEFVQTDRMEKVAVTDEGVFFDGKKVGTIWRQFPIFETQGKLTKMVQAAKRGLTRMIPEFAHFGNKSWFALFQNHRGFFEQKFAMAGKQDLFRMLDTLTPRSHLVEGTGSFPCNLGVCTVSTLEELREFPAEVRDRLVLKVAGANALASRSYGVLMGYGLKQIDWAGWIAEREKQNMPFIVQECFTTAVETLPVLNTRNSAPEGFRCRILVRPWVILDELVSAHVCAVPSSTLRVHGRVDMAVVPCVFA